MISSYNGIPVYKATLDSEDTGMVVVSLVEDPAVESEFLAFNKQEKLQFQVQSEEQRKVLGVVMVPDKLIYRETADGMPYYIKYEASTIHQMCEKFFANYNVNNVDTDHSFELVDGVVLTQAFFINREKGINPKGFEDMPDDTLMFEYHITNDEVWQGIKDGQWKGFSLAGTFDVVPVELSKKVNVLDEIEGLIEKISNKLNQ